jgi:TolB protein
VTSGSQAWANPDPTWDGQWLVAYTRDPPEGHLYVMLSDGTQQRQLTADSAIDRMPRWSPDKRWIAFFSSRGGPLAVWRIRFDGSDRLQVVGAHSVYPAWSPDGTRLAVEWAADSGGGGQRVTRVVDPNRAWQAQAPEDLPPPAGLPGFTVQDWSPDGTRLAGQIPMGTGAKGIVVYTFASRRYEQLTDFGEWPAWLPDSRRVLFVANAKDYWVVDTRTKQTRKIYTVPNGRLGPARLTRDGRSAYFSRRMTEADIYLLRFEGS